MSPDSSIPIPSTKPYLIRAIHEWCTDQGFTPYVVVLVDAQTRVPREYVKDGQIVLNVGADATHQLMIGNDRIEFMARFNGRAQSLSIPIDNVAAIYARENGQGMAFESTSAMPGIVEGESISGSHIVETDTDPLSSSPSSSSVTPAGRAHLTRIK